MFILSTKITKKKMAIAGAIFAVLVIGISSFLIQNTKINSVEAKPVLTGKTNAERLMFIRNFGWEISDEPDSIIEMIIPAEFDDEYKKYNDLQKEIDLNLEKYKGKRVKKYSYEIFNYPLANSDNNESSKDPKITLKTKTYACLLIFDDKIIGGDVRENKESGFVHSLEMTIID